MYAIPFPPLSPEIFEIDLGGFSFALRWYALAYLAGFLIGWRLIVAALRRPALWPGGTAPMAPAAVENLLAWIIVGVILGGRLGFVLFYQPGHYLANPTDILRVWEGGMSFHGGLLGAAAAGFLFARRQGIAPPAISDAMAMVVPVGLGLGRISNFINAELWGRPTDMPWGVLFPGHGAICPLDWTGPCARHPTQLYEAALEGLLLGLIVWYLVSRRDALRFPWAITGTFFAVYGAARFLVEFWRVPDPQFLARHPQGHVLSLGEFGVTMGQLLSLPMLLAGLALIAFARARGRQ
ncbi:prolipoprotein diacylglyceryl transferase [Pararhodobacter sp. SW119]|uniref:prolipoprotein diacylglyceryl transferase n=1 Tax=Pararhodobacter sp. SW119 TaxID=2780075 RepID=UPI001ADEEB25|nr:prolipoprotein diacylglyceryl transferase [Pararhodobacter sp. SW119]